MFGSDACVVDKSVRGAVVGLGVLLATVLVGRPGATAHADHPACVPPEVTPVLDFPVGAAEGLALSFDGDVFVGNINTGEIWRAPHGDFTRTSRLADLLKEEGQFNFLLGMAVQSDGTLFAAVNALLNPDVHGLWKVEADGSATRVAAAPASFVSLLNDVDVDPSGNVYVSDSIGGAVWRFTPAGDFGVWSDSDLLKGGIHPVFGVPFGVNGIAYRNGALYGAIYLNGRVIEIPIQPDGSAGVPAILVEDEKLLGIDGIEFDVTGNIYATTNLNGNAVKRIRAGSLDIETVLTEGLAVPASLAISNDQQVIYVTNLSSSAPSPQPHAPALVRAAFDLPIVSSACGRSQ
jgi:sugar lactone lactonase YvrE